MPSLASLVAKGMVLVGLQFIFLEQDRHLLLPVVAVAMIKARGLTADAA